MRVIAVSVLSLLLGSIQFPGLETTIAFCFFASILSPTISIFSLLIAGASVSTGNVYNVLFPFIFAIFSKFITVFILLFFYPSIEVTGLLAFIILSFTLNIGLRRTEEENKLINDEITKHFTK